MKVTTTNPFRSVDRYILLVILPVLLFLGIFTTMNFAGLGVYSVSDQGNLVHSVTLGGAR